MWHQKWPLFGARRVWWESIWDEDQLHPWGDGNRKNLHLGREPTGRGNASAHLLILLSLQFSSFHCTVMLLPPKALKVLRTSEFLPYVVFIEAPDFEVLKAMNRSAIESGVVTKQLTVSVSSLKGSWKHTVSPQFRQTGTPRGVTVFTIGPTVMTSSGNMYLSSPIALCLTVDVE